MDVFVLDDTYRRYDLIDSFESLIWTDRYNKLGDFELVTVADNKARELLRPGKMLAIEKSNRIMVVEDALDQEDEDGRLIWVAKGRSLEKILEDRTARMNMGANLGTKWQILGLPASLARNFYTYICTDGILDVKDKTGIPQNTPTPQPGVIPEPEDIVRLELDPMTLLEITEEICQAYDLGYRFVYDHTTFAVTYQIYTGRDRTTDQSTNMPLIFSPDLESLQNITQYTTNQYAKNVAYVFGNLGWPQVVYAPGVNPEDAVGMNRRVLTVTVTDIDDSLTTTEANEYLVQRGYEELSKHRIVSGLDGEISPIARFQYRQHYNVGDLVEMRDRVGNINKMLVTEHIWSSDAEGDKSYPTLTLYQHAESGSWASWPQNREWDDMTTEQWADLP